MLAIHFLALTIVLATGAESAPVEFTTDSLEVVQENVAQGDAVLVDVRSKEEWDEGHLADSVFLPASSLRKREFPTEMTKELPKNKIIYTFCVVGMRAKRAAAALEKQGFDVRALKPGYEELIEAGLRRAPEEQGIRIVLVGDSTVTDGSGWGVGFKKCLADDVECVNDALNGRSSKSYRDEGRWAPVLEMKPDYVLLQFGHNDQPGKGPERESPAETAYRANMTRYVEEARAAGVKPVLVTSLVRRKFNADGQIESDLSEYADVVQEVAVATSTPLVDLHARSLALARKLGPKGSEAFNPSKDGQPDTTHLTSHGSEVIGALVAEELARVVPELATRVQCGAIESAR